jgi:hypothetical protein
LYAVARNGNPFIYRAQGGGGMKPLHISWRGGEIPIYDVTFDVVLHTRGTDFNLYRNEWDKRGEGCLTENDSPLLMQIAGELLGKDTGVSMVSVRNYDLTMYGAATYSESFVKHVVFQACRDAGYTLVYQPRQLEETYALLRVSGHDHPLIVARVLGASLKHWWSYDVRRKPYVLRFEGSISRVRDLLADLGWLAIDLFLATGRRLESKIVRGFRKIAKR